MTETPAAIRTDPSFPMRRIAPVVSALLLCVVGADPGRAQDVYIEAEPNDTPQTAADVTAPVILMGDMPDGDQDAYLWTVSDEDAGRRWTLELQGIAGALTVLEVIRLEYAESGDVSGMQQLLKVGSRDGSRPAVFERLILEPGEYLLGVAKAGGSAPYRPAVDMESFDMDVTAGERPADGAAAPDAYRVFLRDGPALPPSVADAHADRDAARPVILNRDMTAFASDASATWYRLEFNEAQAASRWDIRVQAPVGRTVSASLVDAEGTELSKTVSDAAGLLTLPDISLPAGSYYLQVQPMSGGGHASGFVHLLEVREVGQRVAGGEAEPNNRWALANRAASGQCCSGRIGESGDVDMFVFTLDESHADSLQSLELETIPEQTMRLCLLDDRGQQIQCRDGAGNVTLGDLFLLAGDYGVSVLSLRGEVGTEYTVSFQAAGAPEPGREKEPNDTVAWATGTPDNTRIRGTFGSPNDTDFYRFIVAEEPQLWRVQAIGDNISQLAYHDSAGTQSQRLIVQQGRRRARLDNLYLLPGTHHISVTGRDVGEYTLLARALGPPDPNGEREPNDDETRMQPLRIGQTRTGLLSDPADVDRYRFHLAGWDPIALTATPPADGQLAAVLEFAGTGYGEVNRVEGPIVLEGVFPPGDYHLTLKPLKTSDAEYTLSLERGESFTCSGDCEPNNSPVFAKPWPTDRVVTGQSGEWADQDWYVLPPFESEQPVTFLVEAEHPGALAVYDADQAKVQFGYDQIEHKHTGTIPAGGHHYVLIGGNTPNPYTVTMLLGDETAAPAPLPDLPLAVAFNLDSDAVAAYEQVGQKVGASLEVANAGASDLELQLNFFASDARWRIESETNALSLPAGGERTVAIEIYVPPDVPAKLPVRIGVQAATGSGRAADTAADISAGTDVLPVDPRHAWNIPAQLRGGINVARFAFGATAIAEPNPGNSLDRSLPQLFDGRAALGYGPAFRHRDVPQTVTVDLAGDIAIPVAGFALNPIYRGYRFNTPRTVEFQLSDDGTNYTTVLTGALTTVGTDQFFVLDEPIPARHARLVMDSNWYGQLRGPLTLGEWKVIAESGVDPFGGVGVNLADPELGGHVVWAEPQLGGPWNIWVLTPTEEQPKANVPPGEALTWVVAFEQNRAARIGRIAWRDPAGTNAPIDEVTVSVSLESPLGPWQTVAEWTRSAAGNTLVLDEPRWARFVRFTVPAAEERRILDLPDSLQIHEAPTGPDYRSALSEWGFLSRSGYYESTQPVPIRPELTQRGNESRDTAAPLQSNEPEAGRVRLGQQSQWYRPQVAGEHNTVVFTVTGDPTVRTELVLTAETGEPILLRKRDSKSTPRMHVFDATIEPGTIPYLEIREPPRNVVFLWDTSPSMGAYLPMVHNSVMGYAADLTPGLDTANLLPFGFGAPLMREWHGEPYLMQLVLTDQPRSGGSSAAEYSQHQAMVALAPRAGTKAMVVVTDAHTNRYEDVWDAFNDVQPRVFTLHVGAEPYSQDLMQDWSSVNGGHYAYVTTEGEMEVAFERASAMLRRPASYSVTVSSEFRKAPGPGLLRVISGDDADGGADKPAVGLILDASGSMLQRMDGRRRIEIARDVLTTAVREQIPAGTPTALRVFGHRTPNACETDLEIPVSPLDPDAAAATIANIQAKNLARTPIAASLAAVSRDLRGAQGDSLIVLVTDGEETCDGDPAAEIERLRASDFDVSLNIVGFAIDDRALVDQFAAWAEAGGGRYFAANNAEGLADAVAEALATAYTVYDAHGEIVGEGRVDGDPIELEQGVYRVVVAAAPRRIFGEVEVRGDTENELRLSQ